MMGSREVVTPSTTSSTGLVVFREIEVGNSSRIIASSAPCLCVDDMSSTEGRDLQSSPFPSMDRSKASTLRRTISPRRSILSQFNSYIDHPQCERTFEEVERL